MWNKKAESHVRTYGVTWLSVAFVLYVVYQVRPALSTYCLVGLVALLYDIESVG